MNASDVSITLIGWPYADHEQPLRERLQSFIHELVISRKLDLTRLEGVTITDDLAGSLAAFDSGLGAVTLSSVQETAVAGRMVMTLRDGNVKGHIFIPVDEALQILHEAAPFHRSSVYVFVHEAAHLHDLSVRASAFQEDVLNPPIARPLAICIDVCWNEYAACRIAASAYPDQAQTLTETFRIAINAMKGQKQRIAAQFVASDPGRQQALTSALNAALPVLRGLSYLLGHADGMGVDFEQFLAPNYADITGDQDINPAMEQVKGELRSLWSSYGSWEAYGVFHDLMNAICSFITAATGVVIAPAPNRAMSVALLKKGA